MSGRRVLVVAIGIGLLLAAVLISSRDLLGGSSVSFWLEHTAGIWFVAAFAAGYLARGAVPGALTGLGAMVLVLFLYESVSVATVDGFSVRLTPSIKETWVATSVLVGAGFGFLGGWAAEDREDRWFGASVLGALLVGEAVGLFVAGPPHPAFDSRMAAAQIFAGTGVVLVGARGMVSWPAMSVFLGLSVFLVVLELTAGLVTLFVWG